MAVGKRDLVACHERITNGNRDMAIVWRPHKGTPMGQIEIWTREMAHHMGAMSRARDIYLTIAHKGEHALRSHTVPILVLGGSLCGNGSMRSPHTNQLAGRDAGHDQRQCSDRDKYEATARPRLRVFSSWLIHVVLSPHITRIRDARIYNGRIAIPGNSGVSTSPCCAGCIFHIWPDVQRHGERNVACAALHAFAQGQGLSYLVGI